MDDSVIIITHDNTRITNSNTFPTDKEHIIAFPNQRLCNITKRVYITFTREYEFNILQIRYGSRYHTSGGIIETLRANLAFLNMEKYISQKNKYWILSGCQPKTHITKSTKVNKSTNFVSDSISMMKMKI